MQEYIFLYAIGFLAVIFAVIQDVRSREIANWLTFSLIAFVIAYRVFYSIYSNNFMFFIYGLVGVCLFVGLGYLFYYAKVFAGGDAKLLFGIGGIFPYSSMADYVYYGLGFILLLFISGVSYTLIYSLFLVKNNYISFSKFFFKELQKRKYFFALSFLIGLFIIIVNSNLDISLILLICFVIISPLLFAYIKAVEHSCMIQLVSPEKLTEGDWLERDVKLKGRMIKKNFRGLSFEEILMLRNAHKNVWIKSGVPFAPAFLIALVLLFLLLRYSSWKFF